MKFMYDGAEVFIPSSGGSSPVMTSVTLLGSGWDGNSQQLVEVPEVLADETKQLIIPVPFKAEAEQYYNAGIRCIDQLEGQLKFSAETVPEGDLQVYVVVIDVQKTEAV